MTIQSVQLISIATNTYLSRWQDMVAEIADEIKALEWHWILLTDDVESARKFVASLHLEKHVGITSILPFQFPLASMVRYLAIVNNCTDDGWICYVDSDMKIENPRSLDETIKASLVPNFASHPGYTRPRSFSRKFGLKQGVANVILRLSHGGIGSWETRRKSKAFVPRKLRVRYAQAAIFFGPASKIIELSLTCWRWTELDLKDGIVPRWHDESYLNRWLVEHPHNVLGPEFCYFDFPWLMGLVPVVRAVDKSD